MKKKASHWQGFVDENGQLPSDVFRASILGY